MYREKTNDIFEIQHKGKSLRYLVPNKTCRWRAETLFTKEKETIKWLDRLPRGSTLLDVGANIGMYSIYASHIRGAIVVAIEPESQNFALLCRNINLNDLQDKITPFSAAISDRNGLSKLYLSQFDIGGGGSCHSLGKEVGFDLKPRKSPFVQGVASIGLDSAIESGSLPVPNAIKIDVDGFEHLVINGAIDTLKDNRVRTLCIEVNYNLQEHLDMLGELKSLGFYFNAEQVESSMRKSGPFMGCTEIIFDRFHSNSVARLESVITGKSVFFLGSMAEEAFSCVIEKIHCAEVETDPFPAVYIQDLFPDKFYADMQKHFPSLSQMQPLAATGRVSDGAYPDRLVTLFNQEHFARLNSQQQGFWGGFNEALGSEEFTSACIDKFLPWCANQLATLRDKNGKASIRNDALLVSDRTNYAIGPHTDLPHRLISFLFYLPRDEALRYLGTSFYKHKDAKFTCPGGPHYDFKDFIRLGSAPFLPNSLLTFVRTGRSFHGVEPIQEQGIERRLLINNIRIVDGSPQKNA